MPIMIPCQWTLRDTPEAKQNTSNNENRAKCLERSAGANCSAQWKWRLTYHVLRSKAAAASHRPRQFLLCGHKCPRFYPAISPVLNLREPQWSGRAFGAFRASRAVCRAAGGSVDGV